MRLKWLRDGDQDSKVFLCRQERNQPNSPPCWQTRRQNSRASLRLEKVPSGSSGQHAGTGILKSRMARTVSGQVQSTGGIPPGDAPGPGHDRRGI